MRKKDLKVGEPYLIQHGTASWRHPRKGYLLTIDHMRPVNVRERDTAEPTIYTLPDGRTVEAKVLPGSPFDRHTDVLMAIERGDVLSARFVPLQHVRSDWATGEAAIRKREAADAARSERLREERRAYSARLTAANERLRQIGSDVRVDHLGRIGLDDVEWLLGRIGLGSPADKREG
jgi:hypothetical protein